MARKSGTSPIICDYLSQLGVPHTLEYTDRRFDTMPFPSMFGLSKLLEEYGVKSEGYLLNDKKEIERLEPPFLARTPAGFVLVTDISGGNVGYITQGIPEKVPTDEFIEVWDGNVLLSFPDPDAVEPDYKMHRRLEFLSMAKKWVLGACAVLLFLYAFITNSLYSHLSVILIAAIDLAGLYFTYLLVQKSLNIHNEAADSVCSILQAGGCDSILSTDASKFYGLFGWSEVGFAYFSVSLLTLLLFPAMLPVLALCNLCCLPFTFWSIWYQKFRAHNWCTLCVLVQTSLWLLFFCYLSGGWLRMAWPPTPAVVVLGLTYLGVMLAINAIMPLIEKTDDDR